MTASPLEIRLQDIDQIIHKRREQGTGNREQGTGNREQVTGNREQGAGNREQGANKKQKLLSLKLSQKKDVFFVLRISKNSTSTPLSDRVIISISCF